MVTSQLNIIAALPCEARPLIDHYKLKKIQHTGNFPLFCNQDKTMYLAVSGIGKIKSAMATAYLSGFTQANNHCCFLNVGIAGSACYDIGESILANKITDANSQRSFYPWAIKKNNSKQAALTTYDNPQQDYQDQPLIDMEAYGFFEAALHVVTKEHIQVMKVISDNDQSSRTIIDNTTVTNLISQKIPEINFMVKQLLQLSTQQNKLHSPSPAFIEIKNRWHFSQYQQHQLNELLRRWAVVYPQHDPIPLCVAEKHAAQVLNRLQSQLAIASY